MDALELLTADHNRVRGLFSRFKDAEEADKTAEQAELAGKIVEELEIHTTIEEEIFYPTVHDLSSEIGDVVDEGIEEHRVAKTLIGELPSLEAGSDQWVAKMKVLIEAVETILVSPRRRPRRPAGARAAAPGASPPSGRRVELAEHVGEVELDRLRRHPQPLRDLLVGEALGGERQEPRARAM